MIIGSKHNTSSLTNHGHGLNITIDGDNVTQVQHTKYLGIVIDQNLNYYEQMNSLIVKLNRSVGILKRVSPFIPRKSRITMYNTLVLPHLDYCSTVWGVVPKMYLDRLQRIQNRAMRVILNCPARTHINTMLQDLKWMSVRQRNHFNLCVLMWKALHGLTPPYMSDFFDFKASIHHYSTRSSANNHLHVPRCHQNSLKHRGCVALNNLPRFLKDCDTLVTFKRSCVK